MLSSIEGKAPLAGIFGLEGLSLSAEEKAFFRESDPLGFILFARNCESPEQLRALTDALRDSVGRDAPVLIDQEGGRVQRLKPPRWKQYPPMKSFAGDPQGLAEAIAGIAADLRACGITVNCAPVLDVLFPDTHVAIGDRAFSDDADVVAELGRISCRAYRAGGIMPVIKHMPGLGRANLDTHHDLPTVAADRKGLEAIDFKPFAALAEEGAWGMVGHALYAALDAETPASCSVKVIGEIRKTMGFDGLLLSDDLSMGALSRVGDDGARAAAVLAAGCDIALHCNGKMADMKAVANAIEKMAGSAVMRYNRSVSMGLQA